MGLSENVGCTPLYPMVFMIIIPMKNGYFIGNILNIPNIFRHTQMFPNGKITWDVEKNVSQHPTSMECSGFFLGDFDQNQG